MNTITFPARGFRGLDQLMNTFLKDVTSETNNFMPAVNITGKPDNYELVFMAPGRSKEDFKITLEKDLITVSYEAKEEKVEEGHREIKREFTLKSFKRSFHMDETMDAEKVNARYENGLLTLTIPKREDVKALPKEISIQ